MNPHLREIVERVYDAQHAEDARAVQLVDFDHHFPPGSLPVGSREVIRSLIRDGLTVFTPPDQFRLQPQARLILASRTAVQEECK